MTKIITATAIMQLVEKGLIKLDDDVRPLVPELAKMQILRGFDEDGKPILEDNVKPITLRYAFGLKRCFSCPHFWSSVIADKLTMAPQQSCYAHRWARLRCG